MSGAARRARAVALAAALAAAGGAEAEPIFLSRQYTRCTTCHYSRSGGGLLTPYGRSLSREEISTTGRSGAPGARPSREQDFLGGALGDALGPVSLGIDIRPSHLDVDFEGGGATRDFLMNADLLGAWAGHGWTVYAEVGRQLRSDGARVDSYEHWVSYEAGRGLSLRAGRFLPAFGLRLADHTALTRAPLGLDKYDQVYGVEVSHQGPRHLAQVSLGPGRADSLVDDDGRRAFTASARYQRDLAARATLVVSGLYRAAAPMEPRSGAAGLALGIAPGRRLSVWGEADAQFHAARPGPPAYTLLADAAWEVHRGIWLRLSPQLRTEEGDRSAGVRRTSVALELLPRTHVHGHLSWYHDRDRRSGRATTTWLAQLHLYL